MWTGFSESSEIEFEVSDHILGLNICVKKKEETEWRGTSQIVVQIGQSLGQPGKGGLERVPTISFTWWTRKPSLCTPPCLALSLEVGFPEKVGLQPGPVSVAGQNLKKLIDSRRQSADIIPQRNDGHKPFLEFGSWRAHLLLSPTCASWTHFSIYICEATPSGFLWAFISERRSNRRMLVGWTSTFVNAVDLGTSAHTHSQHL